MKEFNFHVKPIGLFDMLHFKKMVPARAAMLAAGSPKPVRAEFGVNRLAAVKNIALAEIPIGFADGRLRDGRDQGQEGGGD